MDDSEMAPDHHPQAYTFATLDVVLAYQRNQVKNIRGLDPDSEEGKRFTSLYASEQGWPSPACCDDRIRARNICFAHGLASSLPQVIAVTHNYFHDNEGGSEQGGQDYGLIAGNISGDLSNGPGYPTFDAYIATSPAVWGSSDTNYCCKTWRVGCHSTFHYGSFDPLNTKGGGYPPALIMHGWAWSTAAHKAGMAPVSITVSVDGQPVMKNILANVSRPDLVAAAVAPSVNHGFVIDLPIADCQALLHGKHKLSVQGAVLQSPRQGARREVAVPFELQGSPRCLCDFVPCACDF